MMDETVWLSFLVGGGFDLVNIYERSFERG